MAAPLIRRGFRDGGHKPRSALLSADKLGAGGGDLLLTTNSCFSGSLVAITAQPTVDRSGFASVVEK
jgi:hypothetical protein